MTSKPAVTRFREDNPDLAVVVAYGKILRPRVLQVPPMGCINCHASLLPVYRGANPIFWALADGCKETGITTMLMDEGMDTGPMLLRESISIGEEETIGSLHDRLAALSASLLLRTLAGLEAGSLTVTGQAHEGATHAPIVDKERTWIDFQAPCQEIHNWIRALDPRPGARSLLPGDKTIKLFGSSLRPSMQGSPGELLEASEEGITIACQQGAVLLREIQMPGKKRIAVKQYLSGNQFPEDLVLRAPAPKKQS